MLSAFVGLFVIQTSSATISPRYELGERLKVLDVAWMETPDKARRLAAVPHISKAVSAFFAQKNSVGAEELDIAGAALNGKDAPPEAGISVRFVPAICEPGKEATLKIWWTYQRPDAKPVPIRVAGRSVICAPGRTLTIMINPQKIDSDLAMMSEGGTTISIQVGSLQRTAYLNVVKNARKRLQALENAKNPIAQDIHDLISESIDHPEVTEQDIPISQQLFLAEELESSSTKLWEIRDLWRVKHRDTYFRAAFPSSARVDPTLAKPINVVIAYHGAGGSENLFFEAYGRGIAAEEAIHRGWVFVAPRVGTNAQKDVLDWLTTVRKLKIGKIFLMGHSFGGGYALANMSQISPAAVAVFAPVGSVKKEDVKFPLYLAVGKQESSQVQSFSTRMAHDLDGVPGFTFDQFDPCEHMMIVSEAVKAAYAVFDKAASTP